MFTYRGLYKGFQSNSTLVASYCFVNKTSLCLCRLASIFPIQCLRCAFYIVYSKKLLRIISSNNFFKIIILISLWGYFFINNISFSHNTTTSSRCLPARIISFTYNMIFKLNHHGTQCVEMITIPLCSKTLHAKVNQTFWNPNGNV